MGNCASLDDNNLLQPGYANEFRTNLILQLRENKIVLKQVPLNASKIFQLKNVNTFNIRELILDRCSITHEGIEELVRLKCPNLLLLNLDNNQIGPIGSSYLAESELIHDLKDLSLNNNKIKDIGFKAIVGAEANNLQDLSLNDNSLTLTAQGIQRLSWKINKTAYLSLSSNKLTDESIQSITRLKLPLVYLRLSRNQITDNGLQKILNSIESLAVLMVQKNKIKMAKSTYAKDNIFLLY